MEEEFLLNGKTYTSSQLNQYAKKSNMSLDEYIKESGAVRKKTTKAYTLNGKSYDEATIKEYARKSNLSIEEYIKEAGVKKKESSEPTAQERPSVSPAKPTQPSTSSATEQPTRAAASVSLGGKFRLATEEDLENARIAPVESVSSFLKRKEEQRQPLYNMKANTNIPIIEEPKKVLPKIKKSTEQPTGFYSEKQPIKLSEEDKSVVQRLGEKRLQQSKDKIEYYESIPDRENLFYSKRIKNDPEYDGFVEKFYNTSDLQKIGIDIDDFDGFLEKKGLKTLVKTRVERGDFDDDISIYYKEATPEQIASRKGKDIDDKASAKQVLLKRLVDQYIKEKESKNNDYKTAKKHVETGVYDPVYESVFDNKKVDEYVENNLPNLNRRIQKLKQIDKQDYEEILKKNGNVADESLYMMKNMYRNFASGFKDRVVDLISTAADELGSGSGAESWRDYKYLEDLAKPTKKLVGVETNLKKVNFNNREYGVDDNGRIIDIDAEVVVNDFLDPLESNTIIQKAKESKEKTNLVGMQGIMGDFAYTMADMAVQVGTQALVAAATSGLANELMLAKNITSLRNAGIAMQDIEKAREVSKKILAIEGQVITAESLAAAGVTEAEYLTANNVLSELRALSSAKVSNISNFYADLKSSTKIPITKDIGDAMIAQGLMGYSSGYEQTLKSARENGISEEKARELASQSAKLTSALYAITTPIQPNIKIKEAVFGGGLRTSINDAINAYKKGGIKSFKDNLISGLSVLHTEGKKELIQENIQQIGEIYGINKYINSNVEGNLLKDEYTLNDFFNTSVLSYMAGGLLPGISAGIKSNSKTNFTNLYNLGSKINEVDPILNELISAGKVTVDDANKLKREAISIYRNSSKIPDTVPYENRRKISVILEDISDLEEKKKNVDVAFHGDIDNEIKNKREEISKISKQDIVQDTQTPQPEVAKADVRDFDLTLPDNKENIVVADSSNGFILIDSETKAPIEVLNENAGKENVGTSKPYATKEEAQARIEELKAEPEVVSQKEVVDPLKDVESTANALNENLVNSIENSANMLFPKSDETNNIVAEAYHKAKKDGSNPELVKAVEDILGKPTEVITKPAVEVAPATVTYKGTEYSKNDAGNWVNNKTGNEVKGIGPKGKALIATLNNMASTEATTQQQPAATEQVSKTEIEEALDDIVRPKTTNIKDQVERAKKALAKIMKGVEIILHETEEDYSAVTGDRYSGAYIDGKIHLNPAQARRTTVAHEVFHAVLLKYIADGKPATVLTNKMLKAVARSLKKSNPKKMAEINEFVKNGYRGQKEIWSEEKLAEVLGYLASEYETLPQPTKNIIQKWLEKIAIMLKMKPFTDKEVVDFMNTLAERVREGQEVTEQDVAILIKKIDNNESFENEYTPTNGTVEGTSSKRRAQIDDTVIKESDIIDPKTLIGKPLEVVYYDNFTSSPYELRNRVSGSILSKKGEGGPGYSYREEIRKKGIVAAFTNVTKGLNLIQGIRSRNEVAKENAIVGVALQNKETGHLGNKNTELDFYSPTEGVIAQAINDKLITEDQAVKMLKGAVDAYRQTKKGSNPKSSLGFTSNDFSSLDEFYKKINSISFERRGTFNSIVIPSKSDLKITKSTKPYIKTWLESGIPTLKEYYDATTEKYTKEAESHDIVKYLDPNLNKLGVDSTVNITETERKRARQMGVDIVTIDNNLSHTSYPVVLFGSNIGVPSTFNSVRDMAKEWNVSNPFFKAGRRSDKATPVRIPEVKESKKTPKVSARRQISPENSSNYANMTEDGKGNFVFYHYGPRAIKFVDPKRYGSNKGSITSKPEIAAMGRVGGMSQFYTTTEFSEANVVGDKYMIKVPMDKVYDFNTDPDNLIVKAKEMFKEKHPDLPFTANDQLAYITKLAEKAGYDMTVAEWNNRTRAQSTKPLKPVDVQTMDGNTIVKPFKEDYESNVSKGFTPVIPTSKEAMLKKVYDDINAERNRQNKYDDLYHLAEEFPKKTQEEITEMIEGSNISQELKDAYATALSYEPGMRISARRQVNTGAIEENTKSEIDRVKKLPLDAEDGATFNLDGTKYDKGGLIVPVTSLEPNTNQTDLSSEMVAKFTKDNESKIGDDSIVKVGIYKFPDKDTVSVDMSIVIPNKYRAVALEFGKMIGQESLYDLDANENVKTGADGMNPVNLTDEQFRVAAAALKEGQMPQITISRRQQTSAIDTAVAAAKSRGFDDKTIMNYLVSRGYTSEEATRAVLKYNKSVAEKIREEEGVFTRAGRRRIAIALDKFRRITVSKRAFNTKTGLQLREFMEGNINAELREARIALEEYDKMLPKDKAQRAVIEAEADKFLKGDTSANLPLEFKAVVGRFRTHIDNLSMRLIDTGTLTQAQADKLRSNIGQYVNRSYQVFDDPKWKDKVTEEMKEAVRNELRNLYYSMKGNVPKSKKDRKTYADKFAYRVERAVAQNDFDEDTILNKMIEDEINNMLEPKKAADFVGQRSVASKDLSIMKQKNPEIPLSVRQLMGEYGNAGQNYAKTIQKLSALVYKADFLNKMRDLGLGVFFFEKDDPNRDQKEFNTRIAADSSKTMNPLNGLWTTPELAEMFKEDTVGDIRYIEKYLGKGIGSGIMYVYRTYLKTLGAVKKMKTAYSVGGHVKNVLGNVELVLSNAYINPKEYANAFMTLKNSNKGEFKKKMDEYTRLGILSSNIDSSEIRKLFNSDSFDSFIEARIKKGYANTISKFDEKVSNLYQTEDDFFKILGYEIEMKRYEKAYPNKSKEEIQRIVSNNIKNILPNYNRIGQIGNFARALPLASTFMSYQLESYRTAWNNIALAKQEIASGNSELKSIGIKRIIAALSTQTAKHFIMHSLGTVVFSPILSMMAAAGADDEEEKEGITDYDKKVKYMKLMLPEYAKEDNVVITKEGDGKISFINFSSSDPRKGISNTISAAIQGKDPIDGLTEGLKSIMDPFLNEDILLQAVTNIKRNEKQSGDKIYEEAASDFDKGLAITNEMWKVLQPGTYTSAQKIYKSDDVRNEIVGQFTGYKTHEIDVKKNLYFSIKKLKAMEESAMNVYRDANYQFEEGKIDKSERNRLQSQAKKSAEKTYEEMREYLKAASYFGAKDYEIDEAFEKNRISDYVIKTLWANEMPVID